MNAGGVLLFGLFLVVWLTLMLAAIGGMVVGISALVSISRLPPEAFGPWWDNTKTPWLLGVAVSFVIPFGLLVTGVLWFRSGRRTLVRTGVVGRPFWMGPPRPPPPPWPTGWGPPATGWGPPGP